jgi:O-antigen/teichoic acid export membrane protein
LSLLAPHALVVDEVATVTTRRARRNRRVVVTALLTGIGSMSVLAVNALAVPLTIGYLGSERFGLLAAALALVSLLEPLDLGIGSALVTLLARSDGRDDNEGAARTVQTAFVLLSTIAVVIGVLGLVVVPRVGWSALLHASVPDQTTRAVVAVLLAAFVIGLPLALVDRVQLGLQEGHRNGFITLAGSFISLIGLVIASQRKADIPIIAAALAAGPLLARFGAGLVLFRRHRPSLRPRFARPDRAMAEEIVRVGALFFVLQIAVAVAYTSDQLVVARVLGAEATASYAVPFRLFAVVSAVAALAVRPLWPAYAEAAARGDREWVRSTLRRSCRIAFAVSLACALPLVVVGPRLVEWWSHERVQPSWSLLLAMGTWAVMGSTGNAVAMFLNGVGVVRFQVVVASLMAVLNLVLSVALAHHIGVAGVMWGTVVAYGTAVVGPYVWFVRRERRLLP